MVHVALDPRKKPRNIKWTDEFRVFLCCLYKFFENDHSVFQNIFNRRFEQQIIEGGYNYPVRYSTLHSQWVCMKRLGDPLWGRIHLSSFEYELRAPHENRAVQEIQTIACSQGWSIHEKLEDNIDKSGFEYREMVVPQSLRGSDTESSTLVHGGGKICFWCHSEGLESQVGIRVCVLLSIPKFCSAVQPGHMPPILYRWWNVDSQGINSMDSFVAGMFSKAKKNFFLPGDILPEEFNTYFRRHIQIQRTPSPFISTFKSMLAPVHRALRNQEGATVSIIDARKLEAQIYSAKDFVQENSIRIGTYNGAGEYLIWGEVPNAAIICSFKVSQLCRIASENTQIGKLLHLDMISSYKINRRALHRALAKGASALDMQAGLAIGGLLSLLQVPYQYSKDVSEGIAYSWRVKRRRLPWKDFFEGVQAAYLGVPPLISHVPRPTLDNNNDNLNAFESSDEELLFSDYDDDDGEEEGDNDKNGHLDNAELPNEQDDENRSSGAIDTHFSTEWVMITAPAENDVVVLLDSSDEEMGDGDDSVREEQIILRPEDQCGADRERDRNALFG
ncbi:hypothetical protein P175DRAFT_0479047 [Aspergillus ochraceoroseus IBT 24754]|uniref:DUF7587 domain-containing protein n=1 Tax=Aspergillus ochraceoroseus IBT 24754 TaxID=1392256 RepID=A0A2T5LWY3_9EURO|nr:uncharacterized protein P175DRAFT_0479047 [Aspergillus ochraceoroseus IBT 24754]PTU20791.1 hypothetical protein P175DRAFT_0479047 [Aspergillus ochraceoroseus IBT 24754]